MPSTAFDCLRILPIDAGGGSGGNRVRGNELSRNGDSGILLFGASDDNDVSRNTANDNGGFGFLVYGEPGFPVPAGNRFKSNTVFGSGVLDLVEADFGQPDFVPLACSNDWKKNSFGSAAGRDGCIE